jgi:hypothetical protein
VPAVTQEVPVETTLGAPAEIRWGQAARAPEVMGVPEELQPVRVVAPGELLAAVALVAATVRVTAGGAPAAARSAR